MGLLENTDKEYYSQEGNYGNYQFVSLEDIISYFMAVYVGDEKMIAKASRTDIAFFAQRNLAELSFDVLRSYKSIELTMPSTLKMIMPKDYVNYTKLSWSDSSGIKHPLYPTKHTSNPFRPITDSRGNYLFEDTFTANGNSPAGDLIQSGELVRNGNFLGGKGDFVIGNQTNTLDDNNDPLIGIFFINNTVLFKDSARYGKIRQFGVPIVSGEEYKISFTLENYTSGHFAVEIVDSEGKSSSTAGFNTGQANGTFTYTITAGSSTPAEDAGGYHNVYIQNRHETELGNATVTNFSIVKVGDENESITSKNYQAATPSENNNDDYEDDTYWPLYGERYGLEPSLAQTNGSFYIDERKGCIYFSSNIAGKTVILDYISDSLGTEAEMQIHKLAEEAMYKSITYGVLSVKSNIPEYIVMRARKEKIAATRKAKLRLSNVKIEDITQILRGKSKHIKH